MPPSVEGDGPTRWPGESYWSPDNRYATRAASFPARFRSFQTVSRSRLPLDSIEQGSFSREGSSKQDCARGARQGRAQVYLIEAAERVDRRLLLAGVAMADGAECGRNYETNRTRLDDLAFVEGDADGARPDMGANNWTHLDDVDLGP